jgi:uncharacterized protein YkwD
LETRAAKARSSPTLVEKGSGRRTNVMKRKQLVVAGWMVALGSPLVACGGAKGGAQDLAPVRSGPHEVSPPEPQTDEPAGAPPAGAAEQPGQQAPAPSSGGIAREAAAILAAHNRVRAQHCARPLAWSPALAATAQEWANALRDANCGFNHSQTAYGENLAAGTQLSGENAVELWYAESEKYNYKRHGFSPATGHFTQVVWAGSRNLGCGFSECNGMRLWVCHYDPPGNVLSLFPDNVSSATCK